MRAIRTSLISSLTLGLLASSVIGVAAQDEDAVDAAYFTGTIGESTVVGEPTDGVVDGVLQIRGLEREGPIESTDPRITGSLSRVIDLDAHPVGEFEEVAIFTVQHRIENDAGSWAGTSIGVGHAGPGVSEEEALDFDTVLLSGDGAYEGLSAFLFADFAPEVGADIKGVIFPGEMPEPAVAAPAE